MPPEKKKRRLTPARAVWVHMGTYQDLEQLRRNGDTFEDVVRRLIRFHKRFAPTAENQLRKELML